MNAQTEQIAATLAALTEDLYYSLVGDEPYVVVVWDAAEKGEFTVENWLRDRGALTAFELEDFFSQLQETQPSAVREQYQGLVQLLQENLSALRIYGYGFPDLPDDLFGGELPIAAADLEPLGIPLFLGELATGEWLGLAPQQQYGSDSPARWKIPDLDSVGEEATELVERIQTAASAISHHMKSKSWRLSEHWPVVLAGDRASVVEKVLTAARFLSVGEISAFFQGIAEELEDFEPGEEPPEDLQKSLELRDYFLSQLQSSRVFNFNYIIGGEVFTVHYLLGQTPAGDWAGVVTDSFTF